AGMRPQANPQLAETSCCAGDREPAFSMAGLRVLFGIKQAMKMNDEISHLGVVHGLLRSRLPGHVRTRVIGEQADDLHLRKILERVVLEVVQFAAKDEMQQL